MLAEAGGHTLDGNEKILDCWFQVETVISEDIE
jgi:hypothetical protein